MLSNGFNHVEELLGVLENVCGEVKVKEGDDDKDVYAFARKGTCRNILCSGQDCVIRCSHRL